MNTEYRRKAIMRKLQDIDQAAQLIRDIRRNDYGVTESTRVSMAIDLQALKKEADDLCVELRELQ